MQIRQQRHPGNRWKLVYGEYAGVEKTAVNRLVRTCQRFLPYVLETIPASAKLNRTEGYLIIAGTPQSNPLVAELQQREIIRLPEKAAGFCLVSQVSPWNPANRVLILAGRDASGLLHATSDFAAQIATPVLMPDQVNAEKLRAAFDQMADFQITDFPRIENRGLWTWGYVIYDYRRFIENMSRLKMNMLTIWNDCPPQNIADIIDYAHAHGVKIILGFHWGWGMDFDLARQSDRRQIKEMVLREYAQNYRHLNIDGIYFQTLTEHRELEIGGRSVAAVVCEMVNDISRELFRENPDLAIQFGLHATSIRERYRDLATLDPRVVIVWEDAGTLPYAYKPELTNPNLPEDWRTFEETLAYSQELACFRKNTPFALVPKGWTCIDWDTEFEHHRDFILGEWNSQSIRRRLNTRQSHWDRVNMHWLRYFPKGIEFYREILNCKPASMIVTGLIEDGMFEARIQSSVALFAETIWNPLREPDEILEQAVNAVNADEMV